MENYAEYVDYNSTTTQSDRGEMLYTLLDYLRLRASYDRVAWNLQPVVLAHEVLVRSGLRRGGRKLARRRGRADRRHRRRPPQAVRAAEPQVRHAAAEHRRAAGRAVRAAVAGRSALCPGAAGHGRAAPGRSGAAPSEAPPAAADPSGAFRRLEEGIAQFTREISGAGFDLPPWLEALQQEVDRVESQAADDEDLPGPELPIPHVRLSREEVRRQVRAIHGG